MTFECDKLSNGLELIAECNADAVSAAVGFFVRTGARNEPQELAGVSHFLEHMAFKGDERRSADDVNREFDEIGAKYNAYTTEEHTAYHAAVLPEYLEAAIELLSGLLRPALRSDDFETERQVILEEIGMYADSPMWSAYERVMRLHFGEHPLGNNVLGTKATVGKMTPEQMRAYHAQRYGASNILVVASGKVDWPRLRAQVSEICDRWPTVAAARSAAHARCAGANEVLVRDRFVQECIFLAVAGPPANSPLRMSAEVLANVIGDDSGSRLFWTLIEPGKVESADFNVNPYEDAGVFLASVGCSPQLAEENLASVTRVLREATQTHVSLGELEQARNKISSRMVLAAERPQNRLFALAYHWLYRHKYRSVEEDLAELQSVSVASIEELVRKYPMEQPTIVCLGPLQKVNGIV